MDVRNNITETTIIKQVIIPDKHLSFTNRKFKGQFNDINCFDNRIPHTRNPLRLSCMENMVMTKVLVSPQLHLQLIGTMDQIPNVPRRDILNLLAT